MLAAAAAAADYALIPRRIALGINKNLPVSARSNGIRGKTTRESAPRRAARFVRQSTSTSSTTAPPPSAPSTPSTSRGLRDWPSPLPPTTSRPTRCERYGPRLWGLTQPFTPSPLSSFSAENRMSVYALPGRRRRVEGRGGTVREELVVDLWLHNPLPPTDELVSHLEGIKRALRAEAEAAEAGRRPGPPPSPCSAPPGVAVRVRVAHLVVPSSSPEHWSATADALERLGEGGGRQQPEGGGGGGGGDGEGGGDGPTLLWVPPNFFSDGGRLLGSVIREGKEKIEALRPRARLLERGDAQECFGGDVSAASVVGGGLGLFTEIVFHLRAARVVLTADSAFCLSEKDAAASAAGPLDLFFARLAGIYGKLGSPVGLALASAPDSQGRKFAEDVMRWCEGDEVEMVVSCHLSAPVADDAAGQLRRVFGFLL